MGGAESQFVKDAFDTNWIAPLGPNVDGFEADLERYLGKDVQVACLVSGTAAIHMALVQLGVGYGDEVICQSFTFCGSVNPIVYQGATPVLVDSEPDTWNMCPVALEAAIKDRVLKGKAPKAIIIVHLYGIPAKLDAILRIANSYQIPIIEDAAEALGSRYREQACGTFGHFGILSFNGNKIITTSGGGALVCQTSKDKEQSVFLATQARDKAPHYQHSHVGYNYRMSNISAGIGRGQMLVLNKHIALRKRNHMFYKKLFKTIPGVTLHEAPFRAFESNHWLSCITIDATIAGFTPSDLRLGLDADNIESRPLWKPMHLQPVYKEAPYYGNSVAERLFKIGLCLPSGSNLSDAHRERIAQSIHRVVKKMKS
ncbi:DegT/DnrJ/EryC1/StrS family aminotransferase [Flagellimonas marinaquae]